MSEGVKSLKASSSSTFSMTVRTDSIKSSVLIRFGGPLQVVRVDPEKYEEKGVYILLLSTKWIVHNCIV